MSFGAARMAKAISFFSSSEMSFEVREKNHKFFRSFPKMPEQSRDDGFGEGLIIRTEEQEVIEKFDLVVHGI